MSSSTENPFARYEPGARTHLRTKFADLPGITSVPVADDKGRLTDRLPPRPPADRFIQPGVASSAPTTAMPPVATVFSTDHLSLTGAEPVIQRISNIDQRLAVTEKSMKALVYEVVRLQGELGAALRAAEEDRMARLVAENRLRTSTDAVGQLAVRLERIERRHATDEETNAALMEQLEKSETSVLAIRQDTLRRHGQQENRLDDVHNLVTDLSKRLDYAEEQRNETDANVSQKINTLKGSVERQAAASLEAVRSLEARIAEVDESLDKERSQRQDHIADIEKSVDRRLADSESKNSEIESRLAQVEKEIDKQSFEADIRALREQYESRLDSFFKVNEAEVKAVQDVIVINKKKTNRNLHRLNEAVDLLDKRLEEQKRVTDTLIAAEITCRKQLDQTRDNKLSELDGLIKQYNKYLHSTIDELFISKMPKIKEELTEEINSLKTKQNRSMFELNARVDETAANGMKELIALRSIHGRLIDELRARIDAPNLSSQAPTGGGGGALYEKIASLESWRADISENVNRLKQEVASLQTVKLPQLDAKCERRLQKLDAGLEEESKNRQNDVTECKTQISQLWSRIAAETKQRLEDIESLKKRKPKSAAAPATANTTEPTTQAASAATGWEDDIAEIEEKLKKMAETIQIVKTVLGMKIMSESRQRSADIENLEAEIEQLRADIAQLTDNGDEDNEEPQDNAQGE